MPSNPLDQISIYETLWSTLLWLIRQPLMWLVVVVWIALNVVRPLYRIRQYRKAGIPEIDRMSGIQFEQCLEVLFVRLGYDVQLTPTVGDQGGDLILSRGSDRIVVQAKRHSKAVGNKAVQEVTAARAHYKCGKAMVVSNQEFTKQARALANSNQVELWGRRNLADQILKLSGQVNVVSPAASVPSAAAKEPSALRCCERCGQPMVLRNSTRGKFWGCSTFPKCRFTLSLVETHRS